MMCTAAVCSVSSSTHMAEFDGEEESPFTYRRTPFCHSTPSSRKWRPVGYSNEVANLFLQLSPLSDSLNRLPSMLTTPLSPSNILNSSLPVFDLISNLPIELSLFIFSYLSPEELCLICLVCKKWYQLAQDKLLRKKRESFVISQRYNFQQCKENYHNHSFTTPQRAHLRRSTLPVLSPLNFEDIPPQIHNDIRPNTLPAPPPSPSYDHLRTPGPSFSSMLERVERLTINSDPDIRRCLFPGLESSSSSNAKKFASRRLDPHVNRSGELLIGKRLNKGRLRRL